ncbi:MAG TPA: DNA polymerase III subunit chi [Marinobacter sp.]|uniref:DNA polymerase III subunit chi n=2 Tax=root TaxID=1 RepID=A0A831R779_9GAMM|nr:DNA polymerase III subunit chi [Marinobacter antarcticus]HDZ37912.1 DNA polymerase III subunit chi [Marinobacter sp.]HEA53635.1 DNA polymerase III subunit chi [Marinobacter antarcticus]
MENNPVTPAGSATAGGPGQEVERETGQEERNQRYWFHILLQDTPAARYLHASKLVKKAWEQGDRVCIVCDTTQQADELDELLWNLSPDAFIPHSVVSDAATPCSDPVGILLCPPVAEDWDTVIILSETLPKDADRFKRLALVAHNDPAILNQARSHFKQLRALGIEPRVHDQRKR